MTSEDIIELAAEHGVEPSEQIKSFGRAVATRQAERCSRIVWKARSEWMRNNDWSEHEPAMMLLAKVELDIKGLA